MNATHFNVLPGNSAGQFSIFSTLRSNPCGDSLNVQLLKMQQAPAAASRCCHMALLSHAGKSAFLRGEASAKSQ